MVEEDITLDDKGGIAVPAEPTQARAFHDVTRKQETEQRMHVQTRVGCFLGSKQDLAAYPKLLSRLWQKMANMKARRLYSIRTTAMTMMTGCLHRRM
jgi:hypothetical protein